MSRIVRPVSMFACVLMVLFAADVVGPALLALLD